jgi:NADPH:quinone reductase-like Zn-dependent oxidoreductase
MQLINYCRTPNWADEVLRLTNGKGVDHIVEVGGAQTIEKSLKVTRQGGLVSVVGILFQSRKVDIIPALLYGAKAGKPR